MGHGALQLVAVPQAPVQAMCQLLRHTVCSPARYRFVGTGQATFQTVPRPWRAGSWALGPTAGPYQMPFKSLVRAKGPSGCPAWRAQVLNAGSSTVHMTTGGEPMRGTLPAIRGTFMTKTLALSALEVRAFIASRDATH